MFSVSYTKTKLRRHFVFHYNKAKPPTKLPNRLLRFKPLLLFMSSLTLYLKSFCQEVGGPEMNQSTSQPSSVHGEVSDDNEIIRIRKEGWKTLALCSNCGATRFWHPPPPPPPHKLGWWGRQSCGSFPVNHSLCKMDDFEMATQILPVGLPRHTFSLNLDHRVENRRMYWGCSLLAKTMNTTRLSTLME